MSQRLKDLSSFTSVEPVKATLSTSMWAEIAAPAVGPYPGMMFTTPGGNPACRIKDDTYTHLLAPICLQENSISSLTFISQDFSFNVQFVRTRTILPTLYLRCSLEMYFCFLITQQLLLTLTSESFPKSRMPSALTCMEMRVFGYLFFAKTNARISETIHSSFTSVNASLSLSHVLCSSSTGLITLNSSSDGESAQRTQPLLSPL